MKHFLNLRLIFLVCIIGITNTYLKAQNPFSITATSTQTTCYGDKDGCITIDILAGSPVEPLTIKLYKPKELGGGDTIYDNLTLNDFPYFIYGLEASAVAYSIIAIDNSKNSENIPNFSLATAHITSPGDMIIAADQVTPETCYGDFDGTINILFIQNAVYPVSYEWSDGGSSNPKVDLTTGTYHVTITDNNGCNDVFTYKIEPESPQIVIDSVNFTDCINEANTGELKIYASGGNPPLEYSFTEDEGNWGNNNTGMFGDLEAGTYHVTITDSYCDIEDGPYVISECESKKSEVLIYPNPNHDVITIKADNIQSYSVVNHSGKVVLRSNTTTNPTYVDVSNLKKDIYILKVTADNKTSAHRILIH